MRKRFYRTVITVSMTMILFALSACGNNASDSETVPTETENTTESTTESEEETETEPTEKEEESSKEESQKEETEKSEAESKTESDSKKESESKEESKAEPSTKATETKADNSNKTAESTPAPAPVHEHSYTSSVTQNSTCVSQGVRTYVCSCGASYTESIPCTEHTWKEIYGTVEHPSVGEWQQVQVGTSGDVYICNVCGAEFGSASEVVDHCASYVGTDREHATARTIVRDGQPIYESQYIIIQDAWTENTVVGYQCTTCGATR